MIGLIILGWRLWITSGILDLGDTLDVALKKNSFRVTQRVKPPFRPPGFLPLGPLCGRLGSLGWGVGGMFGHMGG